MTAVTLTVNGAATRAEVAPRTHLADFLREQLSLTGTHLGCEQGVCGACTVLIDGRPARSCITFAVACEGADVRTIEGFDDDALMDELRRAFSAHHGLQCGFCTPGMLITARDVVRRLGDTSEARIRTELSGNLCRCTGYVGIVAAVAEVARGKTPEAAGTAPVATGPVRAFEETSASAPARAPPAAAPRQAAPPMAGEGWTSLSQRLELSLPADSVWPVLNDVHRVAACLPGAEIESFDGTHLRGRISVKFGPIKASFSGEGTVENDDAARSGVVRGSGRDTRSGSQVRGEVAYEVVPIDASRAAIEVAVRYRMTGMLSQFSRSGLVQDFVGRLADLFGQNLVRLIASGDGAAPPQELNILQLALAAVRARLAAWFGWARRRD